MKLCYLLAAGLILSFLLSSLFLPVPLGYSSATFTISGLAPQRVAESYSDWATGDVHQAKVVYNGQNFFLFFWEGGEGKWIKKASSSNGITWSVSGLVQFTGGDNISGYAGNVDIRLKNNTAFYLVFQYCTSVAWYVYPKRVDVNGTSLTYGTLWSYRVSGNRITVSKLNYNPNGKVYELIHGSTTTYVLYIPDPWAVGSYWETSSVLGWSNTSGGVQLLNYETSLSYDMLALIKQGTDNVLYYSLVDSETLVMDMPMISMNVTLTSGFSSFCATSEAQNIGDPEIIHLVYIKSTGELCYRKFESDAWSDETVLVSSGSSYPVIASGSSGRLDVFFVKDGKIWVRNFNGVTWLSDAEYFTGSHTYSNPSYLSSSQNAQSSKISLVWTEGTGSPYEVWFSYLDDLEPDIPSTSTTQTWIGISLPHVYAAITVWSLALIVGVGAAFMTGDVKDLPYVILIGLGILVVLFVSLTILSAFGNL